MMRALCACAIAIAFIGCDGGEETDAAVPDDDAGQRDAGTPRCGNAVADGTDECDGTDLAGMTCADVEGPGVSGTLACNDDCTFDVSGCAVCGNAIVDGTEDCDGAELDDQTCVTLLGEGATGTLSCDGECQFDLSQCQLCGNDAVEGTEACDGIELEGEDCGSRGYTAGTLRCSSACTFDETMCTTCGDDAIEGDEDCEGANLGGGSCVSLGFDSGDLSCADDCTYETGACVGCGDGVAALAEDCDGTDFRGADCMDIGFEGGALVCRDDCTVDSSMCYRCGDGTLNGLEECDMADFGTSSCTGRGHTAGSLACTASCTIDEGPCTDCGDMTGEGAEACDGPDLRGSRCATSGFGSGPLVCATGCTLDTSGCSPVLEPVAGQLVITEIMQNPLGRDDTAGEWFEIQNTGSASVNLYGCVFNGTGGALDAFTITDHFLIPAGGYVTFATDADPGFTPNWVWSGVFALGNSDDGITLTCNGTMVDTLAWDNGATWPDPDGSSMNLGAPTAISASANDSGAAWCVSRSTYSGVDRGTPNAPNDRCYWPVDFCRMQSPTTITTEPAEPNTVYGRVYIAGLTDLTGTTDPDSQVFAQVGYGADGSDPAAGGWTWSDATPNTSYMFGSPSYEMNNDEYQGVITAPGNGNYDYAYRFSGDSGVSWTYCDGGDEGSSNGYLSANAGQMTVEGVITVTLEPPVLSIAPSGGTGIIQVVLSAPAGPGGQTVDIMASSTDIAVPASVTIPEGLSRGGIRIRSTAATGSATVTATLGTSMPTSTVSIAAGTPPTVGELVINEFLADVAADLAGTPGIVEGDSSCNGVRDTNHDEYVELINISTHPLLLTGVSIWEENVWMGGAGVAPRFSLPAEVLGPGEAIVVYANGTRGTVPTTSPWCSVVTATRTGDARAINSTMALGLNDGGDTVYITAGPTTTTILDSYNYSAATTADCAHARSPEGTGSFALYNTIGDRAVDRPFSPGTLNSGRGFALATAP